MMKNFDDILKDFNPITLQQMDSVKLQDRIDTKFMFKDDILASVLNRMKEDYYVLDINGIRFNHYETLYYDTKDFDLYLRHHNGRLNRYKFSAKGDRIEEQSFDPSGKLISKTIISYNANGDKIAEVQMDINNQPQEKTFYVYDKKGMIVQERVVDGAGKLIKEDRYTYEY